MILPVIGILTVPAETSRLSCVGRDGADGRGQPQAPKSVPEKVGVAGAIRENGASQERTLMAMPLSSLGLKPFTQGCERSTIPAKVEERPPSQLVAVLHRSQGRKVC